MIVLKVKIICATYLAFLNLLTIIHIITVTAISGNVFPTIISTVIRYQYRINPITQIIIFVISTFLSSLLFLIMKKSAI